MPPDLPAGPKPKRLPRAVREQQMLDAAIAVFARRGYHSASMDEIASVAGISKPMVYLYLRSKEELFLGCIQREVQRFIQAVVDSTDRSLEPDQQLWAGLHAFFATVAANRDAWAVLHQQARAHGQPFAGEVEAMRQHLVALVSGLIDLAVRTRGSRPASPVDVSAIAYALVGACEALADWALDYPDEQPETTAARLMNVAWMGLDNLLKGAVWRPSQTDAGPTAVAR